MLVKGSKQSLIISSIESEKLLVSPSFLYFSYDSLTKHSINWNLTKPLSGTNGLLLKSAPEIEFVVIKVKSVIFSGISLLMILACWQNYVHALFDTAHTSPNGLHDAKYL